MTERKLETTRLVDTFDRLVQVVGNEKEVHRMLADGEVILRRDLASLPYHIIGNLPADAPYRLIDG